MIDLIRQDIRDAVKNVSSAHAGLMLQRGLKEQEINGGTESGKLRQEFVQRVCGFKAPEIYLLAYRRWQSVTANPDRFSHLVARLAGHLFIGLAGGNALETGVTTQHTYGMPMIPGSSVKGAVRAFALKAGLRDEYLAALFGEEDEAAAGSSRVPGAGCLVWHDAWWVPGGGAGAHPFAAEVVTVHHPKYYADEQEASDFDSPVPNTQIAVKGSFHFVVEGDSAWAKLAMSLLERTLDSTGIGAKRAAGYGFMKRDEKAGRDLEKTQQKSREEATMASLDTVEKLRHIIASMSDEVLSQAFGKDKNSTIQSLLGQGFESEDQIRQLVLEIHAERIGSWGENKNATKNQSKAFKYLTKGRGEG